MFPKQHEQDGRGDNLLSENLVRKASEDFPQVWQLHALNATASTGAGGIKGDRK